MDLSNRTGSKPRIAVFSSGLLRLPNLRPLLGAGEVIAKPSAGAAQTIDFVVGWGNRPTTKRARRYAAKHDLPFVAAEDGFLRSAGIGPAKGPPVAICLDDLGIYYDARKPSRLESLIAKLPGKEGTALARQAIDLVLDRRLSKYNPPLTRQPFRPDGWRKKILLIDQVYGDMSIAGSLSDAATFDRMVAEALETASASDLVAKVHPDTVTGKARGYLADAARRAGIELLMDPVNPFHLLDRVDEVWTVSSQLGFEALLHGRRVRCFGVPFYAGWGLTDDRHLPNAVKARRSARPTLEQIFHASHIAYQNYADPISGQVNDIFAAIHRLTDWRDRLSNRPASIICTGFSRWKRPLARAFLGQDPKRVGFAPIRSAVARAAREKSQLAVWGMRGDPELNGAADRAGVDVVRVEDGFLRSVGLGSDIVLPASLCVDELGMYFDPSRPSRIESILSEHPFPSELTDRAASLRERIVHGGLSKYNSAAAGFPDFRSMAAGREVLLVIGQVPDDASIRYGAEGLKGNLSFLQAVREANAGAFILFKEHPDLVRRNRAGWLSKAEIREYADISIETGDVVGLFGLVDKVHTLTSLTGFEALLRGCQVVCWGRPFYAGWGLTEDRLSFERRQRELTIDQLVAGALLLYPRYVDPLTGIPCSAEDVVMRMESVRDYPDDVAWPKPGGGARFVRIANRLEARLRHHLDRRIPK